MALERREGSSAKSGTYVGVFKELMKTKNPKAPYIHDTKNGPVVRYTIVTPDKVEIPGSFPWDEDHYNYVNHLGAFGTPARAVHNFRASLNPNQLLQKLETKWQNLAVELNAWIAEDGGWVAALKPNRGTFQVRFLKYASRDKETDKPIWVHEVKPGKKGGTYEQDIFKVYLQVESGPNEGATFIHRIHYSIKRDEQSGKQYLDVKGSRGQEFDAFFKMHGIDLSKLNMSKFADEDNILPETEPLLIKAGTSLIIEVENGWPNKLTVSPTSGKADLELDDEPVVKKRGVASASPFLGTFKMVCNKHSGRIVFDQNGVLQAPIKWWRKYVTENELPRKEVDTYTDKDIYRALLKLGFKDLARSIKP